MTLPVGSICCSARCYRDLDWTAKSGPIVEAVAGYRESAIIDVVALRVDSRLLSTVEAVAELPVKSAIDGRWSALTKADLSNGNVALLIH